MFCCHSNSDVNKTSIFEKFNQSVVVVGSSLPNRPKAVKYWPVKVGLVCSWKIQSSHLKCNSETQFMQISCLQKILRSHWAAVSLPAVLKGILSKMLISISPAFYSRYLFYVTQNKIPWLFWPSRISWTFSALPRSGKSQEKH